MIAITSSAIGAIFLRSLSIASSKSYWSAVPPPTRAVEPPGRSSTLSRMSGTRASASFVYGSRSRTTSIDAVEPSPDRRVVSVAAATPSAPSRPSIAASMSDCWTAPDSLVTSTVVGARRPAGKLSSISLKPSTESTDFLKKLVLE